MIEFPFDVCFCTSRIPTMFVSVRKMISIFESKKQPRPLSLPPCVSNDQTQTENPILLDGSSTGSKPHPSSSSPSPSTVICRPRLHAGERNVTGGARRVRDSWPIGKLDYYPRAGCLALSAETKQPISSKRFPHTPSRNKPTSRTGRNSSSKPSISTDTAPPAGHSQTQRSENNPRSVRIGSSCKSSVRDQMCQNPEWGSLTSTVREERGGALTHKHRLRPSDSTLLSLLLFLQSGTNSSMIAIDNKIEQAMDLVKSHLMLAVREEVEVLREQIKELSERNAQLERENYILRALRDRD
ncbi:TSC22 domain family protein 4 isoform X2 [Pimephales promelas]|uniref:TSC22 domain family protein 4 isoform X2 n=1 Tax=Pimephales promelas TaxID=90988 RepID=UPI001955C582|nr:TSC22 domain family protein 4 isoform X2 [Pimephales promelas]